MKKKWYDYLWIASLTYLVLGFSIFCLLGWGFCASSFRWFFPSQREQRPTATVTAGVVSCSACWAAGSVFPASGISRAG